MFNDEAYKILKKSRYFKLFALYCYLGFTIFSWVLMLVALGLFTLFTGKDNYPAMAEFMNIYVPGFVTVTIFVEVITSISLFVKKPYLCDYAQIKSIDKSRAKAEVNGKEISSISFDKFIRNQKLDKYNIGDKVLIYSSDKKLRRPMFFKA